MKSKVMKKRVMALLLALVLALTALPASLAEGEAANEPPALEQELPQPEAEPSAEETPEVGEPVVAPTPAPEPPTEEPTPETAPEAPETPEPLPATLGEQLAALAEAGGALVYDEDYALSEALTIPAGVSLTLSGRLTIPFGTTLTNAGALTLAGVTDVHGALINEAGATLTVRTDAQRYPDAPYALTVFAAEGQAGLLRVAGGMTLYGALVVQEGASLVGAANISLAEGATISGKTDAEGTDVLEGALPYGFAGMPEGFALTDAQMAQKAELIAHNAVADTVKGTPGVDYVENEILFWADDEDYAKQVAAAYCGELKSLNENVAVVTITGGQTTAQAVAAGADVSVPLPPVDANQIITLWPNETEAGADKFDASAFAEFAAPEKQSWESWTGSLANPDPALLDPLGSPYQYMHEMVHSYEAWGVTMGQGITVGVLDSGVLATHEELAGRVTVVPMTDVTGESDDDTNGHGTHVSGIIAASLGNGKGGSGIAPEANIRSYCVLPGGSGAGSWVIAGINRAVDDGVNLINMSLGGYYYNSTYNQAIQRAINAGIPVIVAMGNDGSNTLCYPVGYDNVIAVSSVASDGTRSNFSNYGAWADICAPGSLIYSTVNGGNSTYGVKGGTSMATPVVSGVVALYLSKVGNDVNGDGVRDARDVAALEKKLKSATNKTSSPQIGGIIDASKLFEKDKTKPVIKIMSGSAQITSFKTPVPYGARLVLEEAGNAGNGKMIVYTLDGKNPTVKNGMVTVGEEYTAPVSLGREYAGKKLTVKAACISGMGVVGTVSTLTFTIGTNPAVTGVAITGSHKLAAGKSVVLTASVLTDSTQGAASQKVTWSIVGKPSAPGATIDQKGTLKTRTGDTGNVTVKAVSVADTSKSATHVVAITTIPLIKTVAIDRTKLALGLPDNTDAAERTLTVTKLVNALNQDVTANKADYEWEWSSSNPAVVTVDRNGLLTVVGKGAASVTLKMLDGSNKAVRCAVTVELLPTGVEIAGQTSIAPGRQATFKANVTADVIPTGAKNKKVLWSLDGAPAGVTISSTGAVKVPWYASNGTFTVRATAVANPAVFGERTVYIRRAATSVTITSLDARYDAGKATILNVDVPDSTYADNVLSLNATVNDNTADKPLWTSSSEKVATVDEWGRVTAKGAGTARITCAAQDGSNKKAVATIKVVVPASYISIATKAPRMVYANPTMGFGKSVANTAKFGDAYGKPSIQRAAWRIDSIMDGSIDRTADFVARKLVTINSSGTLTVKKNAYDIISHYAMAVTIRASATDGGGAYDTMRYDVVQPATRMGRYGSYMENGDLYLRYYTNSYYPEEVTITSSNPKVASYVGSDMTEETSVNGDAIITFPVACNYAGTARITVKLNDGSNKSCVFNVRIS